MINDLVGLKELLDRTELRDRETATLAIPATNQCAFIVEIAAAEALVAWEIGRDLIAETGRWPLVVTSWGSGDWRTAFEEEDLFDRFPFTQVSSPLDVSPAAILRRAGLADAEAFLRQMMHGNPNLVDRPVSDEGLRAGRHLDWFEPQSMPVGLLFLPTPHGPDALAYLSWYATLGHDAANFIAVLRRWEATWGAELVAHYGTMLQFAVDRPPRDQQSAYLLAREQIAVAPCTTALPLVGVKAHANALVGRGSWFLHERP